ncbi:replisome organizer [Patescibacteria group bacterium]|nr:replisome organizer [Patescibacteria group bacterium]
MFSIQIVASDAFLDMPATSQLLYFHLVMKADDEGFVGNPKTIMRLITVQEDELKILLAKRFILGFESGIVVIKHWLIHNTIRLDRFKGTSYIKEKKSLKLNENKAYTELGKPNGNQVATQYKLSKVNIIKEIPISKPFSPPDLEEVKKYCQERNNKINPQAFIDFYETSNWMRGKNKIKNWKACIRTWESRNKDEQKEKSSGDRYYPSLEEIEKSHEPIKRRI